MKKRFKGLLVGIATVATVATVALFGGCSKNVKEWFCEHKWDDGEVTVVSTCSTEGEKVVTCKDCGATEKRKVDKLPHTEVYIAMTPATCTEDGLTDGKKCSVCEEWVVKPASIPALGHRKHIDNAVAPTCLESGLTEGSHCGRCEIVLEEQVVVPATGHDVVSDIEKEPTCFESGKTGSRYCANCETVFAENEYLDSLEHNFANGYCTHCGMFELEQLSTMDSSKYTATAVSEGTTLEKGAIYRFSNKNENSEYLSYNLNMSCQFSSEYKDYHLVVVDDISYSRCYIRTSTVIYPDGTEKIYYEFVVGVAYDETSNFNSATVKRFGFAYVRNVYCDVESGYGYVYIPENIFTDGNVTVTLLAGAGMEKITLK